MPEALEKKNFWPISLYFRLAVVGRDRLCHSITAEKGCCDVAGLKAQQQQQHGVVKNETTARNTTNAATVVHHYRNSITLRLDTGNNASTILSDNNVSLCTQIRNEPPEDVIEWLTYYRLVYNVSGVCIINDAYTVDYDDIFHAFHVNTRPSRNDRNQNFDLCQKCLGIHIQDNQERIFVTDVDEFLFIQQEERFSEYLSLFNQVSMNALNFGNVKSTRDGNSSLVLKHTQRAPHYCRHESYNNLLKCRDGCWVVKSIVKSSQVITLRKSMVLRFPCIVTLQLQYTSLLYTIAARVCVQSYMG